MIDAGADMSVKIEMGIQEEKEFGQRTSKMLDSYAGQMSEYMTAFSNQGKRLRGVRRKILDIARSLGISESLLRCVLILA